MVVCGHKILIQRGVYKEILQDFGKFFFRLHRGLANTVCILISLFTDTAQQFFQCSLPGVQLTLFFFIRQLDGLRFLAEIPLQQEGFPGHGKTQRTAVMGRLIPWLIMPIYVLLFRLSFPFLLFQPKQHPRDKMLEGGLARLIFPIDHIDA